MARDIDSKMDRLVVKHGPPIPSEGAEGDMTVRVVKAGLRLYIKVKNKWVGVALSEAESLTFSSSGGRIDVTIGSGKSSNVNISGELKVGGGKTTIKAGNSAAASLVLKADNADDAGDNWEVAANTDDTLSIGSDKNTIGTYVSFVTVTGDSTARNSVVTTAGNITSSGGTITAGANTNTQGKLVLWDGLGADKPGYVQFHSLSGTAYYLFVEDDGTVKVHTSVPTRDTDGSEVGGQS